MMPRKKGFENLNKTNKIEKKLLKNHIKEKSRATIFVSLEYVGLMQGWPLMQAFIFWTKMQGYFFFLSKCRQ